MNALMLRDLGKVNNVNESDWKDRAFVQIRVGTDPSIEFHGILSSSFW